MFDRVIQIARDVLIASFNAPITPDRFFTSAPLTQTIANLEALSILSFRGRRSGVCFNFSPISCLCDPGAFQCPRDSHVHRSAKFQRGFPRLIANVVISFHTKRTEFRFSIYPATWTSSSHQSREIQATSRPGLADPFVDVFQTLNTFVMANPSMLVTRISRCGLAINNGLLAIIPDVFRLFQGCQKKASWMESAAGESEERRKSGRERKTDRS
jgi:hypothetical protein